MKKITHKQRVFYAALLVTGGAANAVFAQDVTPIETAEPVAVETATGAELSQAAPAEIGLAEGVPVDTAVSAGGGQPPAETLAGGAVFTIGVSTGLFYEDDDGATRTFVGVGLNAAVTSETRNQRFSFGIATTAEIDENEREFDNTRIGLSYALFNRASELSFDLGYTEAEVGDDALEDDFDADDLTDDEGTRERQTAAIRLITGRDTRFGTDTVLSYRDTNFVDTTDPDLFDNTVYSIDTTLRFTLDRRVELRLFGGLTEIDSDDPTQSEETITRLGVAGDFLIDRAWTAGLSVATTETETEGVGGTTTEDGYEIAATLTRFMPNGTLGFELSRVTDADREIDTFRIARAMELAGGAELSGTIGVANFDTGDVQPLLGLAYVHEVRRGSVVNVTLTQEGAIDDDDDSILRTRLNASLRHELTPVSFIELNGSFASIDTQGGAGDDTEVTSFGIAYGRDLTEDWGLVARANRSLTDENGARTDEEDTFSLTLERVFSFRP